MNLFSQNYLLRLDLMPDSQRMRRHLGTLAGSQNLAKFRDILTRELGIPLESRLNDYSSLWSDAVAKLELRDCLYVTTIRFQNLTYEYSDGDGSQKRKIQSHFLAEARRIFREEQVGYRIDDQGGVHFLVDSAFEISRVSVINGLGKERYTAARSLFEAAIASLDSTPSDPKGAVRNTFFAVESLFRLIYLTAHQLSGSEVLKHLKPAVDEAYKDQEPAIYVAQKQVASLREWIDAAHFYRHEPGTEEPAQPPIEIAIELVSQGAAWRWLGGWNGRSDSAGVVQ
ncbi:MAG: hypothetical protein MO852_14540 [Candidatus Devosia euplotis]|nr:hypothetical protein [Candidatus Devosia euplotis]